MGVFLFFFGGLGLVFWRGGGGAWVFCHTIDHIPGFNAWTTDIKRRSEKILNIKLVFNIFKI
jgi:hypothetical protein